MLENLAYLAIVAVAVVHLYDTFMLKAQHWAAHKVAKIENLADDRVNEIKESLRPQFELWWNSTGERQVQATIDKDERERPVDFIEAVLTGGADSSLRIAKGRSLILATLLNTGNPYEQMNLPLAVRLIARGDVGLKEAREQHEAKLDELRSSLIDCGINLPEFEKEFAPATA